jgi:hypothetical protein
MTYGFQLLEDIRQIRMVCEQRHDELEQHFTSELQNWMKYSQQTQQIMSRSYPGDRYVEENQQVIEKTIANTYSEIYSSRSRRLSVIQSQCDDSLEELLTQRKLSMLTLITDLLSHNIQELNKLVDELATYEKQLQDGLVSCVATQAMRYESRLSSKVLSPEDFCSGPDIKILAAFLKRMMDIITQEQSQFFGDDEDLRIETPCGTSGCKEHTDSPSESSSTLTVDTQPPQQPYHLPSPSFEEPFTPSNPMTEASNIKPQGSTYNASPKQDYTPDDRTQEMTTSTPTTQPEASLYSTEPSITSETTASDDRKDLTTTQSTPTTQPEGSLYSTEPSITSETTASDDRKDLTTTQSTPTTQPEASLYSTEPVTTIETASDEIITQSTPPTQPEANLTSTEAVTRASENPPGPLVTEQNKGEYGVASVQTQTDTSTSFENKVTPEVPGWLDDAVNKILNPCKQNQSLAKGNVKHKKLHQGSFEKGSEDKDLTGNSHSRHADDELSTEATGSGNRLHQSLIYSFATVGFALVVAALVILAAAVMLQHKRRQLAASKLQTQDQKIAIMKETGYVNPTYKLENDE